MALTKLTSNLIEGGTGTDWVTAIQTSNFTAEAGKGYFVNTTSQVLYVNLPVGVVGTEIVIQDYAGTFATNKVILNANGSEKVQGSAIEGQITTNNATAVLIYQDATKGWTSQDVSLVPPPLMVDYLVVAGGGSAGAAGGGAGGAGGLRTSYGSTTGGGGSAESTLNLVEATNYTVTVGAGGAGVVHANPGNPGSNSEFHSITSTGGGFGGSYNTGAGGGAGGSGGGAGNPAITTSTFGAVVSPTQGYVGGYKSVGSGAPNYVTAGGGGAGGAAGNVTQNNTPSDGGVGLAVNILNSTNSATASVGEVSGSDVYYAGGGGGSSQTAGTSSGAGGLGGGTNGAAGCPGTAPLAGTPNTGGGSGGTGGCPTAYSNPGGSGVVILRYTGTYTVTVGAGITQASGSPFTEGSNKVSVFTAGTGNIQFN